MEEKKLSLKHFLGGKVLGIVAAYHDVPGSLGERPLLSGVGNVKILEDDRLIVSFEDCLGLKKGMPVTVHLDNRTGSEEYDVNLRVYRSSYKGSIIERNGSEIVIRPEHYELSFSSKHALVYNRPGYLHPSFEDQGDSKDVPVGRPVPPFEASPEDAYNQVGVLISRAPVRPHTTLMAFHSIANDDVFLVTWKSTLKYKILAANPHAYYAIDNRSTFTFDHHPQFNYTIIDAKVRQVDKKDPHHDELVARFIKKNPFEQSFFASDEAVLLHLETQKLVSPTLRPKF